MVDICNYGEKFIAPGSLVTSCGLGYGTRERAKKIIVLSRLVADRYILGQTHGSKWYMYTDATLQHNLWCPMQ